MRFHEFFKILFLAGFCYLAQLCGGGSTRCGVAVALAIYYTTAVDHSRENSIVLNTAQHCSFVISLSRFLPRQLSVPNVIFLQAPEFSGYFFFLLLVQK